MQWKSMRGNASWNASTSNLVFGLTSHHIMSQVSFPFRLRMHTNDNSSLFSVSMPYQEYLEWSGCPILSLDQIRGWLCTYSHALNWMRFNTHQFCCIKAYSRKLICKHNVCILASPLGKQLVSSCLCSSVLEMELWLRRVLPKWNETFSCQYCLKGPPHPQTQ